MSNYPKKRYAWYIQYGPLGMKKMQHNANNLYDYFCKICGWTKNALAGMLGNMQSESTINPACWQDWKPNKASTTQYPWPKYTTVTEYYTKYMYAGKGFGLVQWTQQRKFFEWLFSELDTPLERYRDVQATLDYYKEQQGQFLEYVRDQKEPNATQTALYSYELYRIFFEVENDLQWDSSIYNQTFREYTQSTEPAYTLGVKFLHAYERPAEYHDKVRGDQAARWYEYLGGTNPSLFAPWLFVKKPYWLGNGFSKTI